MSTHNHHNCRQSIQLDSQLASCHEFRVQMKKSDLNLLTPHNQIQMDNILFCKIGEQIIGKYGNYVNLLSQSCFIIRFLVPQFGGSFFLVLSRITRHTRLHKSHNTVQNSTHTHTFNSPFSGTTWVSWYKKGKTNHGLDLQNILQFIIRLF